LIDVKWVCIIKLDHNGSKNKFKGKLVDKSFQEHVDFSNGFADVASYKGISLEVQKIYKVH
jgi:hypothetical protein